MPALEVLVTDLAFGLLLGCVFAVIAHGLNLIWGVAKIVNVAHGVFIMLGAYGAYFLNLYLGINPLLSAPVDAAIGLAVGVGFYFDRKADCGVDGRTQERIDPEVQVEEVRAIRPEHDEHAVRDVHDLRDAPDEVQAVCDDREDAAEKQAKG